MAQQLIEQHIVAPNALGSAFQKGSHTVKMRGVISGPAIPAHPAIVAIIQPSTPQQLPPMEQPQGQDVSIKYMSLEELTELPSPTSCFKELEASLSADKEWGILFENLNNLRSLVKYNQELFSDNQPHLASVFKKVVTALTQVCYLVVSKRSAVAKNALISLQEGIAKFGCQMQKLVGVFLQYLFTKLTDSNSFIQSEVDKCLQHIITHTHAAKTLVLLMGSADHKNQAIRGTIAKCFGKLFERIQKGIFFFKEYDRLVKILGQLTRDSCLEVRNHAKEATKVLSEQSDNPEAVLKAVMQQQPHVSTGQNGGSSIQNSVLLRQSTLGTPLLPVESGGLGMRLSPSALAGVSAATEERQVSPPPMAKKITIAVSGVSANHQPYASALGPSKNGIKLKRFSSNTLVALNRTEEFMKENPPISKRTKKPFVGEENFVKLTPNEEEEDPGQFSKPQHQVLMQPQKNEIILSRNRRPQLTAKNFPELEIIPDLMKEIQNEDWQGKVESLATAVAIIKEHSSKFMRSVHLPKFFDMLLALLHGNNQKMQIETLNTLKTDLRSIFKVDQL